MRLRVAPSWWFLIALGAMTIATPGVVAAAAAKLTGGTVTPTTGTTSTLFHYSVHFVGSTTDQAISVRASVAGSLISLTRSGKPQNGTWTGSSTLPVGSWTVVYQATSTSGTVPPFTVPGQVVVTAPTPTPAPSPTSVPTPPPTSSPRPTPSQRPTPTPTGGRPTATPKPGSTPTQAVSPTPFGTTMIGASGSPASSQANAQSQSSNASPSPSPSPAGLGTPGSRPLNVPVEGVVAIGLLGAVTVAAALGERRRRRAVEAFHAQEANGGAIPPPAGSPEQGWTGDPVDDEAVATIDYESPGWTDPPDR